MAKQIKVIKCPQCGSTKPLSIGQDRYRCDKCDTEFFLDNDDINVNVNHRYGTSPGRNKYAGVFIAVGLVAFIILIFSVSLLKRTKPKHTRVATTSIPANRNHFTMLLPIQGQAVAFYLEERKGNKPAGDARKGTYAVFCDIRNGNILNEQYVPNLDGSLYKVEHRRFISDDTDYFIIDNHWIYSIENNTSVFKDVTLEISNSKPALNSGFATVSFVDEGRGEGFIVATNLGKEFYYFPVSNTLYTEEAFRYVAKGGPETLLPHAKEITYYLFRNKEGKTSSNVAKLFGITYTFNNGGPEHRLPALSGDVITNTGIYRITSYQAVTEDVICFSPKVLYYDNDAILITYRTTLAKDADSEIRLLDVQGNILWTMRSESEIDPKYTVRTDQGFVLQTGNTFLEISADGKSSQSYRLTDRK